MRRRHLLRAHGAAAPLQAFEEVDRLQQLKAAARALPCAGALGLGRAGVEVDDLQQLGQKPADGGIALQQLILEILIGFLRELADDLGRGVDGR